MVRRAPVPSKLRYSLLFICVALATCAVGVSSAFAGKVTVTHWVALTGSVGSNSSCRSPGHIGVPGVQAAIDEANSGDTIHLCAGTWNTADTTTGGGFAYYDKNLTFEGAGKSNTIIDGTGRTLPAIAASVDSNLYVTLTVRDLTIQNAIAEDPSAISSYGPLTIEDARIRNNGSFSAAIGMGYSGGSLTIRRSTLTGQAAGAEYPTPLAVSFGPTMIEKSTFRDNVATTSQVGGIYVLGETDDMGVTIDSSTFSNLEGPCGSAVANYSTGARAFVSVSNSTFTGNQAGDGECPSAHILSYGDLSLTSSTFAGNTGTRVGVAAADLLSGGSLVIGNSIVGGESGPLTCLSAEDPSSLSGNVISDDSTGCDDFVGGTSPSLEATVPLDSIELSPLADNGGPTETMALGSRSVARGAAIPADCPDTDQRGVPRGTRCDSGAYQAGGKPKVMQKGRAGARSLRVRVKCGSAPCQIKLTGTLKGGGGNLVPKTVRVGSKGKTVTLSYSDDLKKALRAKGGSGVVSVRAREVGGGSAGAFVRVSLPAAVTG